MQGIKKCHIRLLPWYLTLFRLITGILKDQVVVVRKFCRGWAGTLIRPKCVQIKVKQWHKKSTIQCWLLPENSLSKVPPKLAQNPRILSITFHPSFSRCNMLVFRMLSLWRVGSTLHNPSSTLHCWNNIALGDIKLCFRSAKAWLTWSKAMLYVSFSYLCALCQVVSGTLSPYGRLLSS